MTALLLAAILPAMEMHTIRSVASEYHLDHERTALLVAIRKFENGRPGKEFGVETPRAMRYKDGILSLRTQARWAAATIVRRYTGDIDAFAARWCPVNRFVWAKGVKSIMRQAKEEL